MFLTPFASLTLRQAGWPDPAVRHSILPDESLQHPVTQRQHPAAAHGRVAKRDWGIPRASDRPVPGEKGV